MAKILTFSPPTIYKKLFFLIVFSFILLSPVTIINLHPASLIVKADAGFTDYTPSGTGYGTVSRQTAVDNGTINTPADQTPVGEVSACAKYDDKRLLFACQLTERDADDIQDKDTNWKDSIVLGIPRLILEGTFEIAAYSNFLLTYIIINITGRAITTDTTFDAGWTLVRDLANMIIVLGFVIIGIATTLRIREYEAKQLLGKLIAIALLVNFSGLFCGMIIDAANLTTNGLTADTTITGGATKNSEKAGIAEGLLPGSIMLDAMNKAAKSSISKTSLAGAYFKIIENCFLFSIIFLGTAFTFLYLSAIFIARYAILAFLFILSPLAFAFWIYPATKNLWSEWWTNFLKWAFVGVFGSFCLYISAGLVGRIALETDQIGKLGAASVILIFLYVGFKMTAQKTGIASMAGAAIKGLAGGAVGFAMGAVAGGAGGALKAIDRKTGGHAANMAERLKRSGRGMATKVGLMDKSTMLSANAAEVDKHAKNLGAEYADAKATGNQGEMARIQGIAVNGKGAKRAGAIKALSDAKDLHKAFGGDLQKTADGIKYAEAAGATGIRSGAEKLDPRLRGYNEQAKAKQTPGDIAKHGSAAAAAVAEGYSKATQTDIQGYSEETLKDKSFATNVLLKNPKRAGKAAENMNQEQIEAIKNEHMVKPGRPLAQQGDGVKAMYAEMNKHPLGSAERQAVRGRIVDAQHELANNPYLA